MAGEREGAELCAAAAGRASETSACGERELSEFFASSCLLGHASDDHVFVSLSSLDSPGTDYVSTTGHAQERARETDPSSSSPGVPPASRPGLRLPLGA